MWDSHWNQCLFVTLSCHLPVFPMTTSKWWEIFSLGRSFAASLTKISPSRLLWVDLRILLIWSCWPLLLTTLKTHSRSFTSPELTANDRPRSRLRPACKHLGTRRDCLPHRILTLSVNEFKLMAKWLPNRKSFLILTTSCKRQIKMVCNYEPMMLWQWWLCSSSGMKNVTLPF